MFIRSPAASHTVVKFLILIGTVETAAFTEETMTRETSPSVKNSVVFPRSLIVMREHDCDCAQSVKDIKASNKMSGYVPLSSIFACLRDTGGTDSTDAVRYNIIILCVSSPDPMHALTDLL